MKNLKKLFLTFLMIISVFAVVSCSGTGIAKVDRDFKDAGYNMYEYKNTIAVNFNLDRIQRVLANNPNDDKVLAVTMTTSAALLPVDRLSLELRYYILKANDINDTAFGRLTPFDPIDGVEFDVIDNLKYSVYIYADSELDEADNLLSKTAVIIAFPSEEYLEEVIEKSQVIQAFLDGKDIDDHVNGNLLLLIPANRQDFYDEIVEIFNASKK